MSTEAGLETEIIHLNVGGKLYTTNRSTLTCPQGTMLEAMSHFWGDSAPQK